MKDNMSDITTIMVDKIIKEIKEKGSFKLRGVSDCRKVFNIPEDNSDDIIEKRFNSILNKFGIKAYIIENIIRFEKIDGNEIPDNTIIDIYIKKEIEGDEYIEPIKRIHYHDIKKSSRFCPEHRVTLKSGESLCFSIIENQKYSTKGIVDREKTKLRIKLKFGKKYRTITEKSKTEKIEYTIVRYDYYPSTHPSRKDKINDKPVIKIMNISSNEDIIFKGKDEFDKDRINPYEFWIYLETSSERHIDNRKTRISPYIRGHPKLIPAEDVKIKKKNICIDG